MRRSLSLLPLACALLCGALVVPFPTRAAEPAPQPKPKAEPAAQPVKANTSGIEYNRDIRPILAENCFACHGPDSAARKADLRIDQRDGAIATKAIVPGKPDESEMIKRILADDDSGVMPPAK